MLRPERSGLRQQPGLLRLSIGRHLLRARPLADQPDIALQVDAAGDRFTQADCSAWNSLPLVSLATRAIYGEDLIAAGGIDLKSYIRLVGERPSAQKVSADRKAAQERMAAKN